MPAAEPCTPTPPVRFDGSPVPDPATLRFNSNDGVRLRVCGPGILTLRAEGTAVDGVGARLLVALDADTLWDATVDGTEDVRVALPRAGWLVVAFANDRYAPPQDRNLVGARPGGARPDRRQPCSARGVRLARKRPGIGCAMRPGAP